MRTKLAHHWFRSAPSYYLNQCLIIVNWTLANIFQWKFNQNTAIFIEENARETVVCEMASILSRPQCVKASWHGCAFWNTGPFVRGTTGERYKGLIMRGCVFSSLSVWTCCWTNSRDTVYNQYQEKIIWKDIYIYMHVSGSWINQHQLMIWDALAPIMTSL